MAHNLGISKVSSLGTQEINSVLCVAFSSGTLSLIIFFAQRSKKNSIKETHEETNSKPLNPESDQLFDRALTAIKENKHPGIAFWRRLSDVVFVLFDYGYEVSHFYALLPTDPIWSGVGLLLNFLPGLQLHSYKHLGGRNQRLSWFLASLFFPFTVVLSRVNISTISHRNRKNSWNIWKLMDKLSDCWTLCLWRRRASSSHHLDEWTKTATWQDAVLCIKFLHQLKCQCSCGQAWKHSSHFEYSTFTFKSSLDDISADCLFKKKQKRNEEE